MSKHYTLAIVCGAIMALPAQAQQVKPAEIDFTTRHETCLENIADDPDTAYEDAMIWQAHGGGRRARHCVAMALFALGHADEGAFRLEKIAEAPDGGTPKMRADYYVQAADMWMSAGLPRNAYGAATKGLLVSEQHTELLVALARAHAALGRWEEAEAALTKALNTAPDDVAALRYRADVRRRLGNLNAAMTDIEKAMVLDGKNIDVLLVRGQIKEDLRLKAEKEAAASVQ